MNTWKVIGYIFAGLGTLFFFYAFLVGLEDTINPSTAMLFGSSDSSMESFFSLFLSAIAPWVGLASVMFVLGGIGLYAGRNKHPIKPSNDQDTINARIDRLEKLVDRNFEVISKRLDEQDDQPRNH